MKLADANDFCDLVMKLYHGPQDSKTSVVFAESLLKTHNFFQALRVETCRVEATSGVADDCLETLATMLGGVDPSRNSRFQRLVAKLETLLCQSSPSSFLDKTCELLLEISNDIANSNREELSQKLQCGLVDVLMKALQAHRPKFAIVRGVFGCVFQILDSCPNQRHVLMHLTDIGEKTKESLLQYLVKFVSLPDPCDDDVASVPDMQLLALKWIEQVVSGSLSYHSLSDFSTSGCYGSPKMGSLLTANVLESILKALGYPYLPHPESARLGHTVIQAFCEDSERNTAFFAGNRSTLRAALRRDETVQEFRRLMGIDAAGL
jgi:hypothetical protein